MNEAFDYSRTIFGDQERIDVSAADWSAVRIRRCLEALQRVSGRVLEIGCGAGRCIRTVKSRRPDLECHGCDVGRAAIERARGYDDAVIYDVADATRLPYPDGHFDAVIMLDLMEHIPEPIKVLREAHRVCRAGGVFHLHVPCEGASLSLYKPLLAAGTDLTRQAVGHLHHFQVEQVRSLLKSAGFAPVRTRHSMHWFGQMHDMVNFWAMIRRRKENGTSGEIESPPPGGNGPAETAACRPLAFVKRYVWRILTALPRLQYLETRLLERFPFGGIGLCITSRCR